MRRHRNLGSITILVLLCLIAVGTLWSREEPRPEQQPMTAEELLAKISDWLPERESPPRRKSKSHPVDESAIPDFRGLSRQLRELFPWVEADPPPNLRSVLIEKMRANGESLESHLWDIGLVWAQEYLSEAVSTWPQADILFSNYQLQDDRLGIFTFKPRSDSSWWLYSAYYTRQRGPVKDWSKMLLEIQTLETLLEPHTWLKSQDYTLRFQLAGETEESAWRAAGLLGRPLYYAEVRPGCTTLAEILLSAEPGSPVLMWNLSRSTKISAPPRLNSNFSLLVQPDGSYQQVNHHWELLKSASGRVLQSSP